LRTFPRHRNLSGTNPHYRQEDSPFLLLCGGKGKVFDKLKKSLSDNTFAGEIAFINPLKQDTGALASQIRLWVGEISSGE
jgi:hypothetical protein